MGRNGRNIGDFRRYLSHWICFSFSGHHCSLKAQCGTSPQPSPQTLPLLSVGNTPHPLYHLLKHTITCFQPYLPCFIQNFEIEEDTRRRLKTSEVIWITSVPHRTERLITWPVGGTVCGCGGLCGAVLHSWKKSVSGVAWELKVLSLPVHSAPRLW